MGNREEILALVNRVTKEFGEMVYLILSICNNPEQVRGFFDVALEEAEKRLIAERKAKMAVTTPKTEKAPSEEDAKAELSGCISRIREAGFTVDKVEERDGERYLRVGGKWMSLHSILMLGRFGALDKESILKHLE